MDPDEPIPNLEELPADSDCHGDLLERAKGQVFIGVVASGYCGRLLPTSLSVLSQSV